MHSRASGWVTSSFLLIRPNAISLWWVKYPQHLSHINENNSYKLRRIQDLGFWLTNIKGIRPHMIYFALHLMYLAKISLLLYFRGARLQPCSSHWVPGMLLSSLKKWQKVFLDFWLCNKINIKTMKICHIIKVPSNGIKIFLKKTPKKPIRSILLSTGTQNPTVQGHSS